MARQSKKIDRPAEISGSKSMRALSHLDRMAGFVEVSSRIARATAGVAMPPGHRWQLPAHPAQLIGTFAAGARALNATARVSDGVRRNEAATSMAQLRDSDRTTASVDADGRASREIRELSLATDALSRVERSIEWGSAAWATSTSGRRATRSGLKSSSEFAQRAHRAIEIA